MIVNVLTIINLGTINPVTINPETIKPGISSRHFLIVSFRPCTFVCVFPARLCLIKFAQIILLTPLMLPIVVSLGVDPIVFGIIMIISCEVGFLTPPVGANLFVAARITNLGIEKISTSS